MNDDSISRRLFTNSYTFMPEQLWKGVLLCVTQYEQRKMFIHTLIFCKRFKWLFQLGWLMMFHVNMDLCKQMLSASKYKLALAVIIAKVIIRINNFWMDNRRFWFDWKCLMLFQCSLKHFRNSKPNIRCKYRWNRRPNTTNYLCHTHSC